MASRRAEPIKMLSSVVSGRMEAVDGEAARDASGDLTNRPSSGPLFLVSQTCKEHGHHSPLSRIVGQRRSSWFWRGQGEVESLLWILPHAGAVRREVLRTADVGRLLGARPAEAAGLSGGGRQLRAGCVQLWLGSLLTRHLSLVTCHLSPATCRKHSLCPEVRSAGSVGSRLASRRFPVQTQRSGRSRDRRDLYRPVNPQHSGHKTLHTALHTASLRSTIGRTSRGSVQSGVLGPAVGRLHTRTLDRLQPTFSPSSAERRPVPILLLCPAYSTLDRAVT